MQSDGRQANQRGILRQEEKGRKDVDPKWNDPGAEINTSNLPEVGTVLSFSSAEGYYIRTATVVKPNGEVQDVPYRVHQGMFQDSVLLRGKRTDPFMRDFEFCFFPYAGNRLRFYTWTKVFEPVYLANEGNDDLEIDTPYGDFLIPAGASILVSRSAEHLDRYRIDQPIAPPVDRHNANIAHVYTDGSVSYSLPDEYGPRTVYENTPMFPVQKEKER